MSPSEPGPGPGGAGVPGSPPVVAAFDFDGTLTSRGSVWAFLAGVAGRRRLIRSALAVIPQLVAAVVIGGRRADEAKEALFERTLGGRDAVQVATVAAAFGTRHFAAHRRADVVSRLEQHRRLGHLIVLVSASPELYVGAVGQELGVDHVVATKLAVGADGLLTGRYDGRNCRGEQKITRLRSWLESTAPKATLWAYGNSAGDRRMLRGADVGVNVGRLGRFGKLRAFPRLGHSEELLKALSRS